MAGQLLHLPVAPMLGTVGEAVTFMRELAESTGGPVAVIWDRGWGDSDLLITVHRYESWGVSGQDIRAHLTPEVYADLMAAGTLGPNWLNTRKARLAHDFMPVGSSEGDDDLT